LPFRKLIVFLHQSTKGIMEVNEPIMEYGHNRTPNGYVSSMHSVQITVPERDIALKRLKGCITLPDDFDYKKEISDAILEKYLNQ
jgi:hypothetical protein